jgi:hypothetical protein
VPVEDLYVTRLIDSAALWPDGSEVALTTNQTDEPIFGSYRLSVPGPCNLYILTTAKSSPCARLMAVGLRIRKIKAATSCGTSTSFRVTVDRQLT